MKLEELARSSADAARASVRTLEPPPVGERPRSRTWTPVLAGATVAAVVVGGLVLINRGDGGPSDPVAAPPSEAVVVPRLGLALDDSWRATFATDGSDQADVPTQRFDYYGDASAARPFADDDLLIAWGPDTGEVPAGDPVTVRGVGGAFASGDTVGLGADVLTLTWNEPNGTSVLLASRHADGDRLSQIAEGLLIDAVAGVAPDPSVGLDRVGSDTGTPFVAPRGEVEASLVAYESVGTEDLSLVITSRRAELDQAARAAEWWLGAPSDVPLADGTGVEFDLTDLFGGDGQTGRLLLWAPARGVTAQIIVSGPDTGLDLAALADSAIELDDATWESLLLSEGLPDAGTGSLDVVYGEGGGEIEGAAYAWSFGERDGQLCFNFSSGNGGSSSCQALSPWLGGELATAVDQGASDQFGYWLIAADPSVDMVVDTGGGYDQQRFDLGAISWFVAVGPAAQPASFEAMVDGEVVAVVEGGVAAEEVVDGSEVGPAILEADPTLAENPSARELGVADMGVIDRGEDGALEFWLGTTGDRLCLVTDGAAISAGCAQAGDISVFPPIEVAGSERVFVVLRDLPTCITGTGVDGPDVGGSASVSTGDHRYELMWGAGPVSDWEIRLTGDDGTEYSVELPEDGAGSFPAGLCG